MASRNGTKRSEPRSLRVVVRQQGRSYTWLARQTGYSADHISKVARGDHSGTAAFHLAMERVLGERYEWPRGVKRPDTNGAAA